MRRLWIDCQGPDKVAAVSPLIASYPLFTFLIAASLGQDVLTRRLLAGVIAVVAGVIIISVASAY